MLNINTPSAIIRPAPSNGPKLFNVIAVLADQKPIHRVNARRMSKVAQLLAEGAVRAYAVWA